MFWKKKKSSTHTYADSPTEPLVCEDIKPVSQHEPKTRYIDAEALPYHLGVFESGEQIIYVLSHDIREAPELKIDENTSDGYHTFKELYHHRAVLFSVICRMFPEKAWRSKYHSDGSMFDGMFIVGINTPDGQATYHYDIDPYWNMFNVRELDRAPEYDGHTPDDAIRRIGSLTPWFPPANDDTLNTIVTPYTLTCQDFEVPEAYYYESDPE